MTRGDRPEVAAPPEIFYNEEEARKYTTNSRMIAIQVQHRCLVECYCLICCPQRGDRPTGVSTTEPCLAPAGGLACRRS